MKTPAVSCKAFCEMLDALMADALDPDQAQDLLAHKYTCEECGKVFENAQALVAGLGAFPSLSPRPHVVENLERSIEARWERSGVPSVWTWLQTHSTYRLVTAISLGLIATFVSIFSFGLIAFSLEGMSQTLLVSALFWICGYTGVFDLAFRSSLNLPGWRAFNLIRAGKRTSIPVLLALGVATLGLLATLPFGGLSLIFPPPYAFNESLAHVDPYVGWFLLGTVVGGVSLLVGIHLGNAIWGRSVLHDGISASLLFVMMIAPGFAIICAPFSLGLFFAILGGLVVGAFTGGVVGMRTAAAACSMAGR